MTPESVETPFLDLAKITVARGDQTELGVLTEEQWRELERRAASNWWDQRDGRGKGVGVSVERDGGRLGAFDERFDGGTVKLLVDWKDDDVAEEDLKYAVFETPHYDAAEDRFADEI